jgi:repressor LexA
MSAEDLTPRQKEVFLKICGFMEEHGYAPSLREVCELAGLKSTNAADDLLHLLQVKGYISRVPRIARSIKILRHVEEKKTE